MGELNTLTGTVTSPCGTNIASANVTLATLEGNLIKTTQTDFSCNYEFADVSPGYYNITATKRGYWPDSDLVTVTAGEPTTADILLYRKGGLEH